jgi:hypothetical protein
MFRSVWHARNKTNGGIDREHRPFRGRIMLRTLIYWLHRFWAPAPLESLDAKNLPPMSIDEFARLLNRGKPEDLKMIAVVLGQSASLTSQNRMQQ